MLTNIRELVKSDAFSGVLLMFSFLIAIIISNTSLNDEYNSLIYLPISLNLGTHSFKTNVIKLVNDGLMTFFFLLLSLEMKYHLIKGEYSDHKKLLLPSVAAIGGVVGPALIFMMFNYGTEEAKGWAIPIATDTAFVLGIVSFFARSISLSLKIFILGFSLIDDAFAIIILAVFYSDSLTTISVVFSFLITAIMFFLNFYGIKNLNAYITLGVFLWVALLDAGIHPTLAGVILAFAIPLDLQKDSNHELVAFERKIRNIVAYAILPIFAFINSEINFKDVALDDVTSNLSLGIICGLSVGKQIGIIVPAAFCVYLGYAKLPEDTSWGVFYGISILGGIGYTLSLFIGTICFEDSHLLNNVRASVILSSVLCGIFGAAVIKLSLKLKL